MQDGIFKAYWGSHCVQVPMRGDAHKSDTYERQKFLGPNQDQDSITTSTQATNFSIQLSGKEGPRESRCPPDSIESKTNGDCARRKLTNEQIEAKRAREWAQYASMTPEQRHERHDCQNVQYASQRDSLSVEKIENKCACQRVRCSNMTPEQKKATKGVISCASQELKDLYNLLEHEFLPLDLATEVQPFLSMISKIGGKISSASSIPEVKLSQYIFALENLT